MDEDDEEVHPLAEGLYTAGQPPRRSFGGKTSKTSRTGDLHIKRNRKPNIINLKRRRDEVSQQETEAELEEEEEQYYEEEEQLEEEAVEAEGEEQSEGAEEEEEEEEQQDRQQAEGEEEKKEEGEEEQAEEGGEEVEEEEAVEEEVEVVQAPTDPTTVLVRNLDKNLTAVELLTYVFPNEFDIVSATLVVDENGNSIGSAEVIFSTEAGASEAYNKHSGRVFQGKTLQLTLLKSRVRKAASITPALRRVAPPAPPPPEPSVKIKTAVVKRKAVAPTTANAAKAKKAKIKPNGVPALSSSSSASSSSRSTQSSTSKHSTSSSSSPSKLAKPGKAKAGSGATSRTTKANGTKAQAAVGKDSGKRAANTKDKPAAKTNDPIVQFVNKEAKGKNLSQKKKKQEKEEQSDSEEGENYFVAPESEKGKSKPGKNSSQAKMQKQVVQFSPNVKGKKDSGSKKKTSLLAGEKTLQFVVPKDR
eukprot:g77710.t1